MPRETRVGDGEASKPTIIKPGRGAAREPGGFGAQHATHRRKRNSYPACDCGHRTADLIAKRVRLLCAIVPTCPGLVAARLIVHTSIVGLQNRGPGWLFAQEGGLLSASRCGNFCLFCASWGHRPAGPWNFAAGPWQSSMVSMLWRSAYDLYSSNCEIARSKVSGSQQARSIGAKFGED